MHLPSHDSPQSNRFSPFASVHSVQDSQEEQERVIPDTTKPSSTSMITATKEKIKQVGGVPPVSQTLAKPKTPTKVPHDQWDKHEA